MKSVQMIYNSIRLLFDPATEGDPHVRLIRHRQARMNSHMQLRLHRKIVIR